MAMNPDAELTTKFIRQLVAQDIDEEESRPTQNATAPLMVSIPFEELQHARLMLRQFIVYLKSHEPRLGGDRPVDRLSPEELKRLAWVYERRIKSWLSPHDEQVELR